MTFQTKMPEDTRQVKGHNDTTKKQFPKTELEISLQQEIPQHEKRLNDQFALRKNALEKEIAELDYEIEHLEKYILSLYPNAFDQQQGHTSSPCTDDDDGSSYLSYLHDSHGNLHKEQTATTEVLKEKHMQNPSTNVISLEQHLGISDHIILETPNKLSEDMVKCISTMYCKLSGQPFTPSFSPISSYSTMIEVPYVYMDNQRLTDVDDMLQSYRSLVCRLEEVDPRKMKHEEKLAFWINIHNALVMHAFLEYGIPQNNLKRVSLLLKAAYNVGGQTISADLIQTSILGCRMPRPGQWLWKLYSPRTKLKAGDDRQTYAIERTEPLLHFALCSGSHSDPSVRVYTPKRVSQELESAKEEYIRANFGVWKKQKILLPKVLKSFAKDAGLCPINVVEMIQKNMPENHRKSMQRYGKGRTQKSIEWLPHNFAFCYLISKELIK